MNILQKLQKIQTELKVNKGQRNNFGKYNYRSAEDILEAIKPISEKYQVMFKITEELKQVADFVYVESIAQIFDLGVENKVEKIESVATAVLDFDAKGMQNPQRTGAASSYAKKYALGNLLLIDDTKDSDATNNHSKAKGKPELKMGSTDFKKVLAAVKNGYTIDQVKSKYSVSSAVEKLLIK
tara:strand:+ start:332 stop:880 length:549 start_codon:yes stop_codon:yes gene_type:complete